MWNSNNWSKHLNFDMKYIWGLSILFLIAGGQIYGQFEGKIIYNVTYKSNDPSMDQFISMLPGESSLTVKGSQSRFEQHVAGGGKQVFVSDAANQNGILMLNFLGQEFQVKLSTDSMAHLRQNTSLRILKAEGSKMILGYKCKKALGVSGTDTLTIYYTDKLKHDAYMPLFSNMKGMPMEYELIQNNLHLHFTAKSVDEHPVSPDTFTISKSVKEISFQDFARAFAEEAESK